MPPQTNSKKRKKTSRRFVAAAVVFGLTLALLILANRLAIYDWFRLRGYQVPNDVAQLASDDKFTGSARHIYYVNHPLVEGKADFAKACPSGSKETAVLGCYVPDQRGIFVLSVTDARLAGIEQVTAAHEMLHAAYDRLSGRDKVQIDGWLMDYYQHDLHDQTIIDQIDSYKKTEPNDLVNEMHSVFGTEVATLPANLENYYHRYFADRAVVTRYYENYQEAFTSRKQLAASLQDQLKSLKSQIDTLLAQLESQRKGLDSVKPNLYSQQSVDSYNARVNAYNANVAYYRQLVQKYNDLVEQYNSVVFEENQLVKDISAQSSSFSSQ